MTVVLDSPVLIDHLRGDPRAVSLARTLNAAGERISASILTKIEVLAGVRPDEEAAMRRLFAQIAWVEVDDEIAERAGAFAAQFLRSHSGIGVVDYAVAATTLALRARLLTTNRRHFPMFTDLRDPYTP